MKKFDINKARQGAAVCTRKGKEVRILCYDMRHLDRDILVVLVKQNSGEEYIRMYNPSGVCVEGGPDEDLMMAPVKKNVWLNFYKTALGNIVSDQITWDNKDDAVKNSTEQTGWLGAYEVEVEI